MRLGALALLVAVAVGLVVFGAHGKKDAASTARVSVQRLVEYAEGKPYSPPVPGMSAVTVKRLAREQLHLFMSGVIDSGEGELWCVALSGMPPFEVDALLIEEVRKEYKPDDAAAPAVREALQKKFPCGRGGNRA